MVWLTIVIYRLRVVVPSGIHVLLSVTAPYPSPIVPLYHITYYVTATTRQIVLEATIASIIPPLLLVVHHLLSYIVQLVIVFLVQDQQLLLTIALLVLLKQHASTHTLYRLRDRGINANGTPNSASAM